MLRVTDASPIFVPVPFVDETGAEITPTAATWRLFDQDDVELTAGTVADIDTDVLVQIAGEHNVITGLRGARKLRVTFETDTGPVAVDIYYLVTKATILELLENSFLTFGQALVLRESFGGLMDGWDVATNTERMPALEHAFHKIARLAFRVMPEDPSRYASFEDDDLMGVAYLVTDIASMPIATFRTLSSRFVTALQRAQLIEADNLLGGDVVGKRRRDGILSETTGESSMMFNSRPSLDLPLSREAHRELAPFIYRKIGLTRG